MSKPKWIAGASFFSATLLLHTHRQLAACQRPTAYARAAAAGEEEEADDRERLIFRAPNRDESPELAALSSSFFVVLSFSWLFGVRAAHACWKEEILIIRSSDRLYICMCVYADLMLIVLTNESAGMAAVAKEQSVTNYKEKDCSRG